MIIPLTRNVLPLEVPHPSAVTPVELVNRCAYVTYWGTAVLVYQRVGIEVRSDWRYLVEDQRPRAIPCPSRCPLCRNPGNTPAATAHA